MKKFFCLLICLLMIVPSALAGSAPRRLAENEPLYTALRERSMELAGLFNEALHSEEYLALLQLPDSLKEELSLLQMQDFTLPWDVTIVRADEAFKMEGSVREEMTALLAQQAASSPALYEMLRQRLYASTGTYLLASSGTATIALSSVLAFSDAFIRPEEMDGPCFVIMQYGGLYAFLVTFVPTANGAVIATAQFIPSRAADDLNMPTE